MPLVKAQCTSCGANLEVDESKEAAICPFCNTPYVVEKAINQFQVNNAKLNIQNANINVSGILDADTMFENWLVSRDSRLKEDFQYYYATDERCKYVNDRTSPHKIPDLCKIDELYAHVSELNEYIELVKKFCAGPKLGKYLDKELASLQQELNCFLDKISEIERLEKYKREKKTVTWIIVGILAILTFIFFVTVSNASIIACLFPSLGVVLLGVFIVLRMD